MSTYDILKNNSAVQALVMQIYIGSAPQGITAPYVVLDYVSTIPENDLDGVPTIEDTRIAIECIAIDQQGSIDIYNACRTALETTGAITIVPIIGQQDKDTKMYHTIFDYSVWESR